MRSFFVLVALSACSSFTSTSTLSAEDELLLSATNGAEEGMVSRAALGAVGAEEDPDQPPLFRECNADGTFAGLFESYDADRDAELSQSEATDVEQTHAGRDELAERDAMMRMALLGLIYDTNEDGELSDDERAPLYEDFTLRCEALSALLLETFDADGDGALSDEELATAESTMEAEREAHRAEMEQCMEEEGRGESGEGGPDRLGPPPEPGSRMVPPGLESFDADGDELLSDAELSSLREALRDRIRNGEPIVEPPEGN